MAVRNFDLRRAAGPVPTMLRTLQKIRGKGMGLSIVMNCYECIKKGTAREAVAACRFCGVGLCMEHYAEAATVTQGGMRFACAHRQPTPSELVLANKAADERSTRSAS